MHSNYDGDGFLHGQREKRSGDRARGRTERRVQRQVNLVHPAQRVYKLSNLVDKSVLGPFFVSSGCSPPPFLLSRSVYRCIHVTRFSQTTALKESSEVHETFVASRVLIFRRTRHVPMHICNFARHDNRDKAIPSTVDLRTSFYLNFEYISALSLQLRFTNN